MTLWPPECEPLLSNAPLNDVKVKDPKPHTIKLEQLS